MGEYKWRLVVSKDGQPECCYLETLPDGKLVDASYKHHPGDIDYSEIKFLRTKVKQQILYYVATGHVGEDTEKNAIAMKIAGMIFIDRLTDPNFVPDSLDPDKWIW